MYKLSRLALLALTVSAGTIACNEDQVSLPQVARVEAVLPTGSAGFTIGQATRESLSVRIVDASGRPLRSVAVTFAATGGGSVSPTTAMTNAEGIARTRFTPSTTTTGGAATNSVTVTAGGVSQSFPIANERFVSNLSPANERTATGAPANVNSPATGTTFYEWDGSKFNFVINVNGLTTNPVGAHIHLPAGPNQNAPVRIDFSAAISRTTRTGELARGTFTEAPARPASGAQAAVPAVSADSLLRLFRSSNAYTNIHTTQFPAGEIRGQVSPRP